MVPVAGPRQTDGVHLPSLWVTWRAAAVVAVTLAALGVVARRRGGEGRVATFVAAFASEAAVVFALFAMWQLAATLSITRVTGAIAHARTVWHIERWLHLPSEVTVQSWFLPHPTLVRLANLYYASLHFPVTIAFLVWVFVRRRDRYPRVRNALAVATGACLLVQMIPVAPPRMLDGLGFVDTALRYGQSVYGSTGRGIADQLSAMPSVHVAWAVLVAVGVCALTRSRWRWLAVVHAALTVLVVVVTANHFWLDGIVAVALLGLGWLVATAIDRVPARRPSLALAVQSGPEPGTNSLTPVSVGGRAVGEQPERTDVPA